MEENGLDNAVRATVYRLFVARGRAPLAIEVAAELDRAPAEVESAFRRLNDAHMLVLAPGTPYIWMANPFSALPTPYSVTCEGKTFWANCIWDSFGVIAMLGSNGTIDSTCPDCGEPMRVEVSDGTLSTTDLVVHYAIPAAHWWDDIGFN